MNVYQETTTQETTDRIEASAQVCEKCGTKQEAGNLVCAEQTCVAILVPSHKASAEQARRLRLRAQSNPYLSAHDKVAAVQHYRAIEQGYRQAANPTGLQKVHAILRRTKRDTCGTCGKPALVHQDTGKVYCGGNH